MKIEIVVEQLVPLSHSWLVHISDVNGGFCVQCNRSTSDFQLSDMAQMDPLFVALEMASLDFFDIPIGRGDAYTAKGSFTVVEAWPQLPPILPRPGNMVTFELVIILRRGEDPSVCI